MGDISITGIGVVTPIGIGKEQFWESLLDGRSGIKSFEALEETELPCTKAGYVDNFRARDYISGINCRRLSRYSRFTIAAIEMAISDSGIAMDSLAPERKGLIFSTSKGSVNETRKYLKTLYTRGAKAVSPLLFSQTVTNAPATSISIKYDLKGVSSVLTGISPLRMASGYLDNNKADVIICGATDVFGDTTHNFEGESAFQMLAHKDKGTDEKSRPFDVKRNGYILAEGAVFVVLESKEHAKERGARIYCDLEGYGIVHDNKAYRYINRRESDPIERAMEIALAKGGVNPGQVGYINAMANSSYGIDDVETAAIDGIFHQQDHVTVSSSKGALGEIKGVGHSLGIAHTALSIYHQTATHTLNLEEPESAETVEHLKDEPREQEISFALANSFEQGGNTQSFLLSRAN